MARDQLEFRGCPGEDLRFIRFQADQILGCLFQGTNQLILERRGVLGQERHIDAEAEWVTDHLRQLTARLLQALLPGVEGEAIQIPREIEVDLRHDSAPLAVWMSRVRGAGRVQRRTTTPAGNQG